MKKYQLNKRISIDDYNYGLNLVKHYVDGNLTFLEMLAVLPTSLDLATLISIAHEGFSDKTISEQFAKMVINYYYDRLNEVKNFREEIYFKKLLTPQEVFFLLDYSKLQKLIDGKEISIVEEFKKAFLPVKEAVHPLLKEKVFGNSKNQITRNLGFYNRLFSRDLYYKYTPAVILSNGDIVYVTDDIIDIVEKFQQENNLFPARQPTEQFISEVCKKQHEKDVQPEMN